MKTGLIAFAMLAACSTSACASLGNAATPSSTLNTVVSSTSRSAARIVAEAKVVPVQSAAISFQGSGIVDKVLVQIGDRVQAGQTLAWLDTTLQQAAAAQAEANLAQAQANEQDLLAGATPEEVAVAQAQLHEAQAQFRATSGGVTSADLHAAQAQVQQAQAQLDQLASGPKETDVRSTEAQRNQAQANLQTQRDQLSAAKTNAQSQLEQAANALTQAQASYATAKQNWQYVQDTGRDPVNPSGTTNPQTGKSTPNKLNDTQRQQYYDAYVQAEAGMHSAEHAVQIAQVSYDNARQAEVTGIQATEQQVSSAQANLDKLLAGADPDQLAAARAQVASSKANLDKLQGDQRSGSVAAAQAAVDVAQAQLDHIQAGASKSKLAVAHAQVQSAQAALALANATTDAQQLRAPFAGVVASVDVKPGEYSSPITSVIRLADFSAWQFETDDLTEHNVVAIREGAPVTITLDAIPDMTLAGHVKRIDSFGQDKHGDTVYTVVIVPDKQDPRLRWNMTASVSISASGT